MLLFKIIKMGVIVVVVIGFGVVSVQDFIIIGTGLVIGVYYFMGGVICKLVNKDCKDYNICCFVELIGGFIYNVNIICFGELDFGIV